jgi:hypothetical protein
MKRRQTAARRRGGRGRRGRRCSRRVRLLPRTAPASRRPASPRAAPLPSLFFSSTATPADGEGLQGLLPWVVRVSGASGPVRWWPISRAARKGTRGRSGCSEARGTPRRRRRGRCSPAASPFGRQPKRKGDDDAPGVIAPLADAGGGPACQRRGAARRLVGARAWLAGPPTGRKQSWARSEVGGPRCNSVAYQFLLGLKMDSNLNSNSNSNSPK